MRSQNLKSTRVRSLSSPRNLRNEKSLYLKRIDEENRRIVKEAMILSRREKSIEWQLRHSEDLMIEGILLKEELLNEGFNIGYVKDIVQFIVGGAAEYGIDIVTLGAGAPAGSAAEMLINGLFAMESITSAYSTVKELISGGFAPFKEMLEKLVDLKGAWADGAAAFMEKVKEVIGMVLEKYKKAGEAVQKIVDKIKDFVEKPIQKLVDAVVEGIKALIPDATIAAGVGTTLRAVSDSNMDSIFTTVLNKVMEYVDKFKDWLSTPGKASDYVKEMGGQIVKAGEAMINDVPEKNESYIREGLIDDIWDNTKAAANFVADTAKDAGNAVVGAVKKGWEAIKKFGKQALQFVIDKIKEGIPSLAKTIEDIVSTVLPAFFGTLGIAQAMFTGDFSAKSTDKGDEGGEGSSEEQAAEKLEALPDDKKSEIISNIEKAYEEEQGEEKPEEEEGGEEKSPEDALNLEHRVRARKMKILENYIKFCLEN